MPGLALAPELPPPLPPTAHTGWDNAPSTASAHAASFQCRRMGTAVAGTWVEAEAAARDVENLEIERGFASRMELIGMDDEPPGLRVGVTAATQFQGVQ